MKALLQQAREARKARLALMNVLNQGATQQCDTIDNFITAVEKHCEQAEQAQPAGIVSDVHMSRYTIEWTNGPLPEGTELYTHPQPSKPPIDSLTQPAPELTAKEILDAVYKELWRLPVLSSQHTKRKGASNEQSR